jgi:hypothetical protein
VTVCVTTKQINQVVDQDRKLPSESFNQDPSVTKKIGCKLSYNKTRLQQTQIVNKFKQITNKKY